MSSNNSVIDETLNQLNDKEVFIGQLKEDLLQQQKNSRSPFTELQVLTMFLKENTVISQNNILGIFFFKLFTLF